jgi:hypothetical protein
LRATPKNSSLAKKTKRLIIIELTVLLSSANTKKQLATTPRLSLLMPRISMPSIIEVSAMRGSASIAMYKLTHEISTIIGNRGLYYSDISE